MDQLADEKLTTAALLSAGAALLVGVAAYIGMGAPTITFDLSMPLPVAFEVPQNSGQAAAVQSNNTAIFSFAAQSSSVNVGSGVHLTWTGMELPTFCTLSSDPVIPGLPIKVASGGSGGSISNIGPVMQNTKFVLDCDVVFYDIMVSVK